MLKRDPNKPVDTSKGYEISDVRVSILAWGIALTFVLTFAAFVAMRLFEQVLEFSPSVSSTAQPTAAAYRFEQPPPPGPGLQVNLADELQLVVGPQKFMRDNFGWISEPEGLVHISVEAAIDRVVRDGHLPSWGAPQDAETTAPAGDAGAPAQPEEAVDAPVAP